MDRNFTKSEADMGNASLPPDFLPFTNDFIFSLVMRDPEICLGILKLAIPDEEFSEIRIMKSPNPLIDEQTDAEAALPSANGEKRPRAAGGARRRLPFGCEGFSRGACGRTGLACRCLRFIRRNAKNSKIHQGYARRAL